MDLQKLNIHLEGNMSSDTFDESNSIPSTCDNQCANAVQMTREYRISMLELEELSNIIDIKGNQIKDFEDKLSELEIKLSVYNDNMKKKDDIIATLTNNCSSITRIVEKLLDQQQTYFDVVAANDVSIKSNNDLIEKLQSQINSYEIKSNEKDRLIEEYKSEIVNHEATIKKLEQSKTDLDLKVKKIGDQLSNKHKHVQELQTQHSPYTKLIDVPGIKPFHVQIENIAGPGWIVIQRRVNGKVNFDNDLDAYIEGFGDPKGYFWLGLEKIHRITTHKQHELYIHIVYFDNATHYTQYDFLLPVRMSNTN